MPVYLEETLSNKFYRKSPSKEKTYILAKKKVNLGEFVDNDGITRYLNSMYTPIDIYEPNLTLLSNQLLSPISDLAPTFYRFYLGDTIAVDGIKTGSAHLCTAQPQRPPVQRLHVHNAR